MSKIVKGYNGIMDLDLSCVEEKYHKEVIDQHYRDISDYKKYQSSLKKELRYENTVKRINKMLKHQATIEKKRKAQEEQLRFETMMKRHWNH